MDLPPTFKSQNVRTDHHMLPMNQGISDSPIKFQMIPNNIESNIGEKDKLFIILLLLPFYHLSNGQL